jgi:hypothetical protein
MDTVTSSWRRLSDEPQKHACVYSIRRGQAPPVQVNEGQQVATWENEGGQSAPPTEPVAAPDLAGPIADASKSG